MVMISAVFIVLLPGRAVAPTSYIYDPYPVQWNSNSIDPAELASAGILPMKAHIINWYCSGPPPRAGNYIRGKWPLIIKTKTADRKASDEQILNGGVPQAANLTAHLEEVRRTVPLGVPANFTGMVAIDFEPWSPIWSEDVSHDGWHSAAYQNLSIALVQQARPHLSLAQAAEVARTQFEAAALAFFVETIKLCRSVRPKARWSYYGFPQAVNFHGYDDPVAGPKLRALNDKLQPLWDASDILLPSIYVFQSTAYSPQHQADVNAEQINTTVIESARIQAKTRHHPEIWPFQFFYYNSGHLNQTLTPEDTRASVVLPYAHGASGLVIWGDPRYRSTRIPGLIPQFQRYFKQELAPVVKDFKAKVDACAASHCHDHGRCKMAGDGVGGFGGCECVHGYSGTNCSDVENVNVAQQPSAAVVEALGDVRHAMAHAYDLKDSTKLQMASLHLLPPSEGATPGERVYHAAYMSMLPKSEWEVRVANSTDLISWTFVNKILPDADMPYAFPLPNGWILLAHEQWMREGAGPSSEAPSRLGFKLYYSLFDLLAGRHFNSFVAPLSLGAHSTLEGTPNIFNASVVTRNGLLMVDAQVGFHYNDLKGVDTVGHGSLSSFGPTSKEAGIRWETASSVGYDSAFKKAGCIGNIGQRDAGELGGSLVVVQEGNTAHMPPTVWAEWKLWIYMPAAGEAVLGAGGPTGAGTITQLKPKTHGGSTAFGNPSFKVLPCPNEKQRGGKQCVFVSFFAFGEGAAPGEAGVVAFVASAPSATVAPAAGCLKALAGCWPVKATPSRCRVCEGAQQQRLLSAGCTGRDIATYCGAG